MFKKNYKMILFCFSISLIVLMFVSANSPLYPMNFAQDINAYFTVGKGWINGLIPYLDLFDQKGPVLYLIYAIGALISSTSFIGIFILEVVSFTIFLFYMHKIVNLFIDYKNNYLILPIFAVFIGISYPFSSGGTAEEFILPFLAFSLYYLCSYFIGNELTKKQYFINGLFAGIVFMIKLNLATFWACFILFIFIDLIMKKEMKSAFQNALIFVLAMLIPFIIFNIYFLATRALSDFYDAYFYFNIFAYGSDAPLITKIENALNCFMTRSATLNWFVVFFWFLTFSFIRTLNIARKYKIMFYMALIFTIILVYFSSNYEYYLLVLMPFLIFAFIDIFRFLKKYLNKLFTTKLFIVLLIVLYIVLGCLAYKGTNYKPARFTKLEDYETYKIIEEINSSEDKSLLNYRCLDTGFYFMTNSLPTEKYFFKLNVNEEDFPELFESQRNCIKEKCVNYVLILNPNVENNPEEQKLLAGNYEKVIEITEKFVDTKGNMRELPLYLYKRID